ncbi:MAG: ferritin [Chloroflexi bacterium AL-W]|nr:ferritin [Chloroflexi bacterium AL-N1]NOK67064.1 ferritin [Chloroflexi bacterium AL-N10]NOK74644.1 ferritin [Chloroflexi bacterium AL-N5]NOK81666.1 ferritin [Chloroflexi bacterium AL-W]NOK89136.1 ferritin [Chloroflexi bacterium AL-N15]
MMNETVQKAINEQITLEFAASHVYLSMSAYFESINLAGFAHWMRVQSEEEREHALKFFDFVNDRGGRVMLQAIEEPQMEFASPLSTMELALKHEQKVTASIHNLYNLTVKENDLPAQNLLRWFIDEQVEEEKNADDIVQNLKLIGNDGTGLYMIDRTLAGRSTADEDGE